MRNLKELLKYDHPLDEPLFRHYEEIDVFDGRTQTWVFIGNGLPGESIREAITRLTSERPSRVMVGSQLLATDPQKIRVWVDGVYYIFTDEALIVPLRALAR